MENGMQKLEEDRFVLLKGTSSKVLGNIGNYELNAEWKWTVKIGKTLVTYLALCCLVVAVLLSVVIIFSAQSKRIEKLQLEIEAMRQSSRELSSNLMKELEALKERTTSSIEVERFKRAASNKGNRKKPHKGNRSNSKLGNSTNCCDKHWHVSAVHLEGKPGFYTSPDSGEVHSWFPAKWANQYLLDGFLMEGRKSKIVIPNGGLYLIYAQMYYTANNSRCSYEICVQSGQNPEKFPSVVAECSVGHMVNNMDVSCFTAVVQVLQPGDAVFIRQKQKYVNYFMGSGKTFLGLVSLTGS